LLNYSLAACYPIAGIYFLSCYLLLIILLLASYYLLPAVCFLFFLRFAQKTNALYLPSIY
jgi:hypothetical protein